MKKKSVPRSAFLNRRVLIGLPVLAGVFTLPLLLLLGNPAAAGEIPRPSLPQDGFAVANRNKKARRARLGLWKR